MSPRHRFFVDALPSDGGEVVLPADVAAHLRVLRLEVGDEVGLFDGSGRESRAVIDALDPPRCVADAPTDALVEGPTLHLIQAMPKGKKLEQIVRMTTELGVDAIHLAISERAISRPDVAKSRSKVARLSKIAREASRQSRRRTVPEIHPPAPLVDIAADADARATKLVFWEEAEKSFPMKLDEPSEVWVVVGPEGGLSHTEVDALAAKGFAVVRMGQSILRVETAAPVALALVLDRLGRFC